MIILNNNYSHILNNKTFIDLFCGLGGFRLALESYGAKCVFSSDIDKYVSQTYNENFGDNPLSDITKINSEDIPKHNILCAGFPCQAFSISGKQRGFQDDRGMLFKDIVRIAKYHQPDLLLLENVKNLKTHCGGTTFNKIKSDIENINYSVYYAILNASNYGVPQYRERLYMVCIRNDIDNNNFTFPLSLNKKKCVSDILIHNIDEKEYIISKKYKLNCEQINMFQTIYDVPVRIGTVNKGGQGDRIYDPMGQAITLSANGGGTGSKTGLYYINNQVRKLHPRECARLMGYPDNYVINKSKNQAYKQFGNSVVVDVLQYLLKKIIDNRSIKRWIN